MRVPWNESAGHEFERSKFALRQAMPAARLSSLVMQDEKNDYPKTGNTKKDGSLSPNHSPTIEATGANSL
jgi:hypothetical protein